MKNDQINIRIDSSFLAVRDGLTTLFSHPPLCNIPDAEKAAAETALAEVLNNVVEHAYSESRGKIDIRIDLDQGYLCVVVEDSGAPLPDGNLPNGILQNPDPENPPEGGFGWFLIRNLSTDLRYQRIDAKNRLSFRLPTQITC